MACTPYWFLNTLKIVFSYSRTKVRSLRRKQFFWYQKQGKLIPGRLELKEGIDLTVNALDEASQDIYTGGLDLVVVKKDCILEYGKEIRDSIANARADAIKRLENLK